MTTNWIIRPYTDSEDNHVDSAGNHAVAGKAFKAGDIIYQARIEGTTLTRTRTSVQVGEHEHFENELLMYMDHSYKPTTFFVIRAERDGDLQRRWLEVVALDDVALGQALTFDYNTTEVSMSCPFFDNESQRWVSGFKGLSEEEQRTCKALNHVIDAASK